MSRQIINYLPPILKEVREYKAILSVAAQPEFDLLWVGRRAVEADQFLDSLTINGANRWAAILGIAFSADATLEDKRFVIKTRRSERLPYTIRRLRAMLDTLVGNDGYVIEDIDGAYILTIEVAIPNEQMLLTIEDMLERIVPQNMIIKLPLLYNPHSLLGEFTHDELSMYTHDQLKRDELGKGVLSICQTTLEITGFLYL